MMTTKISDLTADFLQEKGIRHVFGIIGAGNAHLFDSISQKGYTEIICFHHEQAACIAMQTYYRTCGVISAAIVTTGAGSTNTITGVVSAWIDSIPGLIISGNENSKFTLNENPLRIWGVQGYDCVAMVSKVTKYANRVLDPKAVLAELEAAYYHAMHGRPGPCWIDIPMNIQAASVNPDEIIQFKKPEETNKIVSSQSLIKNSKQGASEVLPLLHSAERPVIWLGHGIRLGNAVDLIEPLINTLQCPVLVSWAGIDMIPSEHPLVFGRAGIYGQRAANFVLQNCDFLLTIGTRLAIPQIGYNLSEFARCARIAVVDIDLQELTKHGARVNVPILANAKEFLSDMINLLQTTDYSS